MFPLHTRSSTRVNHATQSSSVGSGVSGTYLLPGGDVAVRVLFLGIVARTYRRKAVSSREQHGGASAMMIRNLPGAWSQLGAGVFSCKLPGTAVTAKRMI